MIRPRVTQVERHLTHACNFSCVSCSHFSQDGHSGRDSVESFVAEVGPWAQRLMPYYVLLLGGEPTLNPDLCKLLVEARKLWPERHPKGMPWRDPKAGVQILLVTNGWLLHKHPDLPNILRDQDIRLDITVHHNSPEYLGRLEEVLELVRGEWGIEPYFRHSHAKWTHIYKGTGKDVMPFTDNDSQASWKSCVSKWCLQLHASKLWKCPPVAYIGMQDKKFGIDKQAWAPFLSYKPLEPTCTNSELIDFINRRCEDICGQCPARPVPFAKPNPMYRTSLPVL